MGNFLGCKNPRPRSPLTVLSPKSQQIQREDEHIHCLQILWNKHFSFIPHTVEAHCRYYLVTSEFCPCPSPLISSSQIHLKQKYYVQWHSNKSRSWISALFASAAIHAHCIAACRGTQCTISHTASTAANVVHPGPAQARVTDIKRCQIF